MDCNMGYIYSKDMDKKMIDNKSKKEELSKRVSFKIYKGDDYEKSLIKKDNHVNLLWTNSTRYKDVYMIIDNTSDLGGQDLLMLIDDNLLIYGGRVDGKYLTLYTD